MLTTERADHDYCELIGPRDIRLSQRHAARSETAIRQDSPNHSCRTPHRDDHQYKASKQNNFAGAL